MANAMLSYLDKINTPTWSPTPTMTDPTAILRHIASTPLLAPFALTTAPFNASQSALLRIIADEIHAAEMVALLQKKEGMLYAELQKERGKTTGCAEGGASSAVDKKKKKRKDAANNNSNYSANDKLKTIENELQSISASLLAQRQDLEHLNNFARSAIQAEYSKLVVTLDPESDHYAALEQSIDYLFHDEDRSCYFREMMPILKKLKDKQSVCGMISELPLMKQFHIDHSSPIIDSLQQELWHCLIYEELKKRDSSSVLSTASNSSNRQRCIKYTFDTLQKVTSSTIDSIKRHYRKKSIKLHPDRMGEEYRPSFEKFTQAKDILTDDTLRIRYLREMTDVYGYYAHEKREEMMMQSHEGWMGRYGMRKGESGSGSRVDREEVKRLEGGLQHQCLRAPQVKIETHEKNSKVNITIRVPKPMYEFYSRVRSITVVCKSTHGVVYKMKMGRGEIVRPLLAKRESELILPSQIYIGEKVLDEGYWDIRWSASLDAIGSSPTDPNNATSEVINTNESYSFTMVVTNKVHQRNQEQLQAIEQHCRVVKGNLANGLHKFNTLNGANRYECHGLLVRASKMHRHLKVAMDKVGQTSSTIYDELGTLLGSSRGIMAQIEMMSARDEKKDDARRFKSFMARVLESDDPIEWMKQLQPQHLEEEGGDINRLYQLFIEGKGKCALLIDSEMLKEASLRNDLFSQKQCKELASRSEAAAVQEAKEEEESRAESERQLAEEEARQKMLRDAELRKKWEMVGNTVVISGLQSDVGASLNGSSAKVIYYIAEKDRFEVEVVGSGKKVLLKKENLIVKYYGLPTQNLVPATHVTHGNAQLRCTNKPAQTTPFSPASKSSVSNSRASAETKVEPTTSQGTDKSKTKSSPATHNSNGKQPKTGIKSCASVPAMTHTSPPSSEKTVYVASTVTKKLTGKKGRSKKALEEQSGAKLDIRSGQALNGYVPVSLSGTQDSVVRAMVLVKNAAGSENVHEKIPTPNPPANQTVQIAHVNQKHVSQHVQHTPLALPHVQPVPSEAKTKDASEANPRELFPPGFLGVQVEGFSALAHPQVPEIQSDIPSQLPSEIGIRNNTQRDPDGSVSSLNDRSHSSRTLLQQHFPLPENDPLLQFLRTQQNCIKGNVDEFFLWLVKSEDVDTIAALKEAVSDEEYLAETMKSGNGSVGLKGFKRKAFQRAVLDHQESKVTDVTASTTATSGFDATESNILPGIESNVFLPSFLYSDFEKAVNPTAHQNAYQSKRDFALDDDDTAPPELICPITHELMTEDPVLAADGVTYERSAIENWFHNQVAQLKMAEEQLRANPHLRREQELIQRGICSPLYGTPICNLNLTPNTSVRNMARAHREGVSNAAFGAKSPSPSNVSMFRFAN